MTKYVITYRTDWSYDTFDTEEEALEFIENELDPNSEPRIKKVEID